MKILVGIPVITGADHCREAIKSVIYNEGVQVLIIDNNAEPAVKDMLQEFVHLPNMHITVNPKNIYVNPAWNQILQYFMWYSECDRVVIMNSDLIMQRDWLEVCVNYWNTTPHDLLLPVIKDYKVDTVDTKSLYAQTVTEGTPGIFITLTQQQAKLVYPIPDKLKIWFGDNWIFNKLRKQGYQTVIPSNLLAMHSWSSSVSKVPEAGLLIEQDKVLWEETFKHQV